MPFKIKKRIRKMLKERLKRHILTLDGGLGTSFQRLKLSEEDYHSPKLDSVLSLKGSERPLKGNHEILNITSPEKVAQVHREYLEAGADIIETNTFGANRLVQEEYGVGPEEVREMCRSGARIALEAARAYSAEKPRFVAGAVGPTSKSISLASEDCFDTFVAAYTEQIGALVDAGVDILLLETVFDTLNCKAALVAFDEVLETRGLNREQGPALWISVSLSDKSGRTLSGQSPKAFWTSIAHSSPLMYSHSKNAHISSFRNFH